MKEINTIEGKAPEVAAQEAPFEIVIRTKNSEYIAHGGPTEQVIQCAGYFLHVTTDVNTQSISQGKIYENKLVRGVARIIDHKELFLMAALGNLDVRKDTDD